MRTCKKPTRNRVDKPLALLAGSLLLLATPLSNASTIIESIWLQTYGSGVPLSHPSHDNAGCALCHDQANPTRNDLPIVNNAYGVAIQDEIDAGFTIPEAFQNIEDDNSDADPGNYTNYEEIISDTQPGWTEGDPNVPTSVGGLLDPDDGGGNEPPEPPVVSNPGDQDNDEDDNVNLQIVATDPDEGDTLTYSAVGLPPGLSINAGTGQISGTVSFDAVVHPGTPPADPVDYNVEISVTDSVYPPESVIFTWTITDLNRAPVAVDDSSANTLDTIAVVVPVLDNDDDLDNDALSVTNVTTPNIGTASANPDGTITYTPVNSTVNYVASFNYTISDGFGGSATATVTVNVTDMDNEPPQVTTPPDQVDSEDDTVSLQIVATDTDGDALTYSASGLPVGLSIDPASGLIDGTVSFDAVVHPATPPADPVDYNVEISVDDDVNDPVLVTFIWTINDLNRDPDAVNDGPFETVHDTSITLDVLANDSDPDLDTLAVSGITNNPARGTVVINGDNTLTYTPDAGFVGDDPFTYSIEDGFGGTAEAGVVLSVTNQQAVARDDVYSTDSTTTLLVSAPGVLGNDTDADGDTLNADLVSGPATGTLNYLDADGSFSYTPVDTGADYTDSFIYVANDGIDDSNEATVTINVTDPTDPNEPPVATDPGDQEHSEADPVNLAIVASDPDDDTLTYSVDVLPEGLSIDPSSGVISGVISFDEVVHPDLDSLTTVTVTVSDGDLTDSVTFDWIVDDVNQLPVALDDGANTDHDTPVTIEVLANDSDADNDPLTVVTILVPPLNGSVVINNDDTITYTPNPGFASDDNFVYEIEDGFGGSASATVRVSVINTPPVANDDSYSTPQDSALNIPAPGVLANDTDAEGDPLTAVPASIPANGSVTLNENGSFLYTPNAGFTGEDSFTYRANDGIDDSNEEATVTVDVTPDGEVGDVYLTGMRTWWVLRLEPGTEAERRVAVWGDGDIKQDATVVLTAEAPANITVTIEPESVTKTIRPNNNRTESFPFMAEVTVTCEDKGWYTILWTATISADQNADPSNDVTVEDTLVQCIP